MIVENGMRVMMTLVVALLVGRLVSKMKLPAILGWLITGMALGPHALGLLSEEVLHATWYESLEGMLECLAGLMIGTELIWAQMKKTGRQIVVMTVVESLGTFAFVSLVFGVIFLMTGVPVYIALLFGGIALATAPAPSLSIVNETKASGPVTRTLIPMAVLDELVGALVFFTVIAMVAARTSASQVPLGGILLLVFCPVILGAATGVITGSIPRRVHGRRMSLLVTAGMLLVTGGSILVLNLAVLPSPVLNQLLAGMAFSAVFANMIPQEQLDDMMKVLNPAIGLALVVVILNLGAPLDYHLVFGAGVYTAVYILSRAIGKYGSAFVGAAMTGAPKTVRNYLGLTLLPHSGVSLVFTGIAVSLLNTTSPAYASLIQGTIAAAAVINEVIAVLLARKGFEWAGELPEASDTGKGKHLHEAGRKAGAQPQ